MVKMAKSVTVMATDTGACGTTTNVPGAGAEAVYVAPFTVAEKLTRPKAQCRLLIELSWMRAERAATSALK